jgi:hypothetical protein
VWQPSVRGGTNKQIKMVIKLKEDSYKNKDGALVTGKELKASSMLPFEYFIASKEFDEPNTGTAKGSDGENFEWTKFSLNVKEYKSNDENTGEVVTVKVNEVCSFFKSAKSFIEPMVDIPVGVDFKVTQIPVDGKAYKTFVIEVLGDVPAVATPVAPVAVPAAVVVSPEPVATGTNPGIVAMVTGLKMAQQPVDTVITAIQAAFPGTSAEEITSLFVGLK